MRQRLLIIEDEEPILRGLIDEFESLGFEVDFSWDGEVGLQKALTQKYDLIILDVMLPSRDGFSICSELKRQKPDQAVIMLTARDGFEDLQTGFSLGADDYVTKPFSVAELGLRVQAVLRRTVRTGTQHKYLWFGDDLRLDVEALEAHSITDPQLASIPFTYLEVSMLLYLYEHRNRPVSRDELLIEVWGYEHASALQTRTVDIHVAKVRKKLEPDPKEAQFLITIRGSGYKLQSTVRSGGPDVAPQKAA